MMVYGVTCETSMRFFAPSGSALASTAGGANWNVLFEDVTAYFACNIEYM